MLLLMSVEILRFIMQHRNCQNFVPALTINFLHYEVFITPNEFVNIQSTTFITQNVKKGSADLELASEGITNVTEYCKLLPVALFPKQQQCGMVFWACPCSCRVHLVRWVNTITILEPKEISRESRKTWSS